jgi:hypothetical protein
MRHGCLKREKNLRPKHGSAQFTVGQRFTAVCVNSLNKSNKMENHEAIPSPATCSTCEFSPTSISLRKWCRSLYDEMVVHDKEVTLSLEVVNTSKENEECQSQDHLSKVKYVDNDSCHFKWKGVLDDFIPSSGDDHVVHIGDVPRNIVVATVNVSNTSAGSTEDENYFSDDSSVSKTDEDVSDNPWLIDSDLELDWTRYRIKRTQKQKKHTFCV